MQQQLLKRKVSPEDNKSKRLVGDIFGVCLSNYGNEFIDDTPLGIAAINFGQAQSRIASFQEEYADSMKSQYIEKLEEGLQLFKEYQALRKKLESRRLDYDSKLSRLQKSKKEKPELEQEMQASKMKYEDSEYDVIQKMAALQEFEDEHSEALQNLLEIQFEYFTRSLEVLNDVRSNWTNPQPQETYGRSIPRRNLSRTLSNNSNGDESPYGGTLPISRSATTSQPRRLSLSRNGSVENTVRKMPTISRKNSNSLSDRDELPPMNLSRTVVPSPALPRRQSSNTDGPSVRNQRKAMYDFEGENADELSFRIGDIIQVIEEVDEGWWVGEIREPQGVVRCGIFPVNYTESISAGPPMPARPTITHSMSSSTTTTTNQSYYNEPEHQPTRTLSATTMATSPNHITPSTSPVPQKKTAAAKRPPPPPPSSRTPPSMASSRSSSTNNTKPPPPPVVRTAPTTPHNQQASENDYFETHTVCGECGCSDYTANVFKKGHCNNCFHKH
ncbi:MAG: hypothetical protein EXX96DRAFT_479300 [Benjaminiella poitrasii]|nr:MAG: hypothetical protein EXX96DRAFT_479300 [Benjaminiella poitrasii]